VEAGTIVSEVTVRFLGCGDAFGSGGRFQTCMLLHAAGGHVLLDCGASALIAMKRFGIDPSSIDAILVTHLHGDHFGGLPFYLLDAQFVARRTRPLVVAGPPGLADRVRAALDVFFPGSSATAWRFALQFVELPERQATTLGSLVVTPFGVQHASGAPAYAVRVVCGGKVIAYSGDTEWTDALIEAAHGADLFICEAYTFDRKLTYHLDYQTLMAHRQELGCRRLMVTHMSDEMLGRLATLDIEAAEDGQTITV
jgi:ribonuclease BN (tRNA processing enzyme)